MSALRLIVYVSNVTHQLPVEELELLMLEARAANQKNGITGVLLYNEGNIMQCFEGPEFAMLTTYARIQASRRHHNIFELMNERVEHRSFDGWEMALVQPTRSELLSFSTAQWKSRAGGARSSGDKDGWLLLKAFWRSAR